MADTPGHRVFLVRQALGPNPRRPMAQDAFAQLLTEQGGRRYYGPEVSLWEQGKKDLTREDIAVIASVDPLRRGKLWIGWGEHEKAPADAEALELDVVNDDPADPDRPLTDAQLDRAERAAAKTAESARATPRRKRGNGPA